MQARKLHLRHQRCSSSHSADPSSSAVSSLLVEPISRSIAIKLSDSSLLLYPPVPVPLSSSNLPQPTSIAPISSSACFLRLLRTASSDTGQVVFLSASSSSAFVVLRGWFLPGGGGSRGPEFSPVRLGCKKNRMKLGLFLDHRHGFSVALAGSVNVLALHSPAEEKIFVYAAKLSGDVGKELEVNLMKCAVIECTSPVFSIQISAGFLLLGEMAGARVFPLRPLIKGTAGRRKNPRPTRKEEIIEALNIEPIDSRGNNLPNGVVIGGITGKNGRNQPSFLPSAPASSLCNSEDDQLVRKVDKAKHRTVKLRQNSSDLGSYFVTFGTADLPPLPPPLPKKATSIQVIPQGKFLVVDSSGDLHLLSSSNKEFMLRFNCSMKVKMLAAYPDLSSGGQIFWISDGLYSVHVIGLTDATENDDVEIEKKIPKLSVTHAIFTSGRIQDIVALGENAVLLLAEGDIYLYEIT